MATRIGDFISLDDQTVTEMEATVITLPQIENPRATHWAVQAQGEDVYYTTDGTEPDESPVHGWLLASGGDPILLSARNVLKFKRSVSGAILVYEPGFVEG